VGGRAVLINFDDQGLTGPSTFAGTPGTPQAFSVSTSAGTVSFDGGVILTTTSNLPANQSSVYGTADFAGSLQNPITITFAQPITNFLVDIINGLTINDPTSGQPVPIEYQLADNQGHSAIFSLPPNTASGAETIGFAATGTQVTISSLTFAPSLFDFFVDNIQFDLPSPAAPMVARRLRWRSRRRCRSSPSASRARSGSGGGGRARPSEEPRRPKRPGMPSERLRALRVVNHNR